MTREEQEYREYENELAYREQHEREEIISELRQNIGKHYRHYKGGIYKLIEVGKHSETLEDVVIYQRVSDNSIWVRPLTMFCEYLDFSELKPRFELLSEAKNGDRKGN